MNYNVNVYYYPEKCGLVNIGTLEQDNLSYAFFILIVVQHTESGRLFWARDHGNSDPTPFEDEQFITPDDTTLVEITPRSFENFERVVNVFPVEQEERGNLIDAVRKIISA